MIYSHYLVFSSKGACGVDGHDFKFLPQLISFENGFGYPTSHDFKQPAMPIPHFP